MNVWNEPWLADAGLRGTAARLADSIQAPPMGELADGVLAALAAAHRKMQAGGMAAAVAELNARWGGPLPVEVFLSGGRRVAGLFKGLRPDGNLELIGGDGAVFAVEHASVERLAERW